MGEAAFIRSDIFKQPTKIWVSEKWTFMNCSDEQQPSGKSNLEIRCLYSCCGGVNFHTDVCDLAARHSRGTVISWLCLYVAHRRKATLSTVI